jgi:hypothetical protein
VQEWMCVVCVYLAATCLARKVHWAMKPDVGIYTNMFRIARSKGQLKNCPLLDQYPHHSCTVSGRSVGDVAAVAPFTITFSPAPAL